MSKSFHTEKAAMRAAFDKAATSYDAAAVLQREVADRMFERLDYIKVNPLTVLDAGCGTGYCAPQLQTLYKDARLIELDLAPGMLQVARAKEGGGFKKLWASLRGQGAAYLCADIESLPLADESVDVIWSSLTLQWCNEPDAAFAEFTRVLKPGGLLMFSTLGPDTLKELRASFAAMDDKEHVNRFIDMHDLGDALVKNGLSTPVMDMEYLTMTYDSAKAIMQDLKDIGAHNVAEGRSRGMLGKAAWQKIVAKYETFRRDGLLPCTYEVVYGHAWKPLTRPARKNADGSQIIEFRPRQS
ncbi:malonyl-ACP O-methyltransferase BioC [Iodobacter sp. LRB]|uniref:malonyl-ACP O-methyltransferase BioC n=1 Tax=unclassified Iodobacter TaxID=235634 RepID=UPI000C105091|nr:malonyl-ACP O-methyltransferase BioC [Iodobacter sp. BJB302]PHU99917.1 malonyl-[acyl-carrier protein] O-methyltransferase BioC [Iodobacter sp. BJB302]